MYRRNIKLLSIFNFLGEFSLFAPVAIIYFSRVSGSYTLGASIFGLTMLSAAIFELPTGIWSDRVGRKGTLILGSYARLFAVIAYAIGLSYWILVIGAILEGISRAFYSGNNDAFLHDTLDDAGVLETYSEHLGKTNSMEQFALGTSAIIGSILASISFSWLLWLSVIPQFGRLIISHLFDEPKSRIILNTNTLKHSWRALKLFISNRKLRLLSLASILSFSTSELNWQFRGAFIQTVWPIWAIGIANFLSNMGASISFYLSGKILRRVKDINMLLMRSIYARIVTPLALIFPTIFSPILMSSVSVLYGAGQVAENKLMQKEFSDGERATMSSLNSLGGSIGFALMSLFLGGLADSFGPAKTMLVLTIISMPVIYLYWAIFRNDARTAL